MTKARLSRLAIAQNKWDGQWRLFMFDIPEKHKILRNYISRHLKQLGFKQLQRSVFAYPYPIDDFVAILKYTFPEIEKYIVCLTTQNIDAHYGLVKQFSTLLED